MVESELKKQVEAVLFASGKKIAAEEIARLCTASTAEVTAALKELEQDYHGRDSSIMVSHEGALWNLVVREKYMAIVQQINPHTELSRPAIETLAVIAWKAPVLQSDVVKTRTTNAYEHIHELVDAGFVTKERHGRSYALKLAPKFFDYFDLKDERDIKERFKDFQDIAEPAPAQQTLAVVIESRPREGSGGQAAGDALTGEAALQAEGDAPTGEAATLQPRGGVPAGKAALQPAGDAISRDDGAGKPTSKQRLSEHTPQRDASSEPSHLQPSEHAMPEPVAIEKKKKKERKSDGEDKGRLVHELTSLPQPPPKQPSHKPKKASTTQPR